MLDLARLPPILALALLRTSVEVVRTAVEPILLSKLHLPAHSSFHHVLTCLSFRWRSGPTGPKSLCNACGLRWAKVQKINVPGGSPGSSTSSSLTGGLQQTNLGSPLQSPSTSVFGNISITPGQTNNPPPPPPQQYVPYSTKTDLDTNLQWQQ